MGVPRQKGREPLGSQTPQLSIVGADLDPVDRLGAASLHHRTVGQLDHAETAIRTVVAARRMIAEPGHVPPGGVTGLEQTGTCLDCSRTAIDVYDDRGGHHQLCRRAPPGQAPMHGSAPSAPDSAP